MALIIAENSTILFQGDSITDAGRDRNEPNHLGYGYVAMIAQFLDALYPERRLRYLNRGISGNRAKDLLARWETDCLQLRPDWVSILIGINDTWRRYDANDPTSTEAFLQSYRALLQRTREKTSARLILMEPFVLHTPPDRQTWREDLDPKIRGVQALAKEFDALLVPLDRLFKEASLKREPAFWAPDGVHPSPAGNALIAQAWLRTVGIQIR
ncbi:MAG: SGNH/GDSL hydrolase family protein [Fimbriimonadales bacterium]